MATVLYNCRIVNEGAVREGDVRMHRGRIDAVGGGFRGRDGDIAIDAGGCFLLPGLIDDQVHFREPGLTHKATIATESRAAAAGGITSFMDMPNVIPPTLEMREIDRKLAVAGRDSLLNFAFYLGASRDNLPHIAAADKRRIAGVKIFMGASTGDMLVDDEKVLRKIFAASPVIIAVHCENNARILRRLEAIKKTHSDIPARLHPRIRDVDACFDSSSRAVALAGETGARVHILHISTEKELSLFSAGAPGDKLVTAEACVPHLLFDDEEYETLGMRLKCNPAVKSRADKTALRRALAADKIDVLATDHAPHLAAEKDARYELAAAGLPSAEYALPAFLQLVADGDLSIADVAQKGAHNVADIFAVDGRGYIREGYFADVVLAEYSESGFPVRENILGKCGWTPFAGRRFSHRVRATFVNGEMVWDGERVLEKSCAMMLQFNR